MSILEVKGLSGGYGKKTVFKQVNLSVNKGEFCALLGLNGCGKSTLIKTICNLLPAFSGECYVNEIGLSVLNPKKTATLISYIPQRVSHIYGKTVLDVVLMGFNSRLGLFESPNKEHETKALKMLEKLGALYLKDSYYEEISEGQKQLVILARCLVQDTPVVMMDEPDSALDIVNRRMVLSRINNIVKEQGKSVIAALHDPNSALEYCDRIFLMKDNTINLVIDRKDFKDRDLLISALSSVYGDIDILFNNSIPVLVNKTFSKYSI